MKPNAAEAETDKNIATYNTFAYKCCQDTNGKSASSYDGLTKNRMTLPKVAVIKETTNARKLVDKKEQTLPCRWVRRHTTPD